MAKPKAKPTVVKEKSVKNVKTAEPLVGDAAHAQELAVDQKKKGRDTVLVEYTPNELVALVGGDTKLQVGRKSLAAVQRAAVLAAAGLK